MVESIEIMDFLIVNIVLVVGFLLYNILYQYFFLKRRIRLGHYKGGLQKIQKPLKPDF
jgi:uncharacterized membrane protein YciS (DUF1049 family)